MKRIYLTCEGQTERSETKYAKRSNPLRPCLYEECSFLHTEVLEEADDDNKKKWHLLLDLAPTVCYVSVMKIEELFSPLAIKKINLVVRIKPSTLKQVIHRHTLKKSSLGFPIFSTCTIHVACLSLPLLTGEDSTIHLDSRH